MITEEIPRFGSRPSGVLTLIPPWPRSPLPRPPRSCPFSDLPAPPMLGVQILFCAGVSWACHASPLPLPESLEDRSLISWGTSGRACRPEAAPSALDEPGVGNQAGGGRLQRALLSWGGLVRAGGH